jgi:mRNA interferase RelE/StbE
MAYKVIFKPSAEHDFSHLPGNIQRQVNARILALADNPRPHGVEKLKGQPEPLYRIRSGDYRIVYAIHDQVLLILVVRVQHRREVYRGL